MRTNEKPGHTIGLRASFSLVFKGQWHNVLLALFFFFLAAIHSFASPILTARLIDLVRESGPERTRMFFIYGGMMLFFILLNYPAALVFYRFNSTVTRSVGRGMRSRLCRQLQQLTLLYHDRHSIGSLQNKAIRDIETIERFPRMAIEGMVSTGIVTVAALVTIAVRAPKALVFFLALVVMAVLIGRFFARKFKKSIHEYRTTMEKMSASFSDMLTMLPVTRAHGLEEYELGSVSSRIDEVARKGRAFDIVGGSFGAASFLSVSAIYTVFLCGSIWFCFEGVLTVGDVVMFTAFFSRLSGGIQGVLGMLPEVTVVKEAINSIHEVLNAPDLERNERKHAVAAVKGMVRFDGVTYAYPGKTAPAVAGLSFEAAPGTSTALVGPSGCGKSTTIALLLGFVRPQAGRVLLDGLDMETLDLRTFRRHVGVVTQNTVYFSGTVGENVAYGIAGVKNCDIVRALERAQAMDFVKDLPGGVDCRLGEGGYKLSGGQQQRLSIARALIRDPRILIFDEATSALDVHTEAILQETLLEMIRNRTTFIISHRLSTVRSANKIVVMEQGKIVVSGTHDELMAGENFYSKAHLV